MWLNILQRTEWPTSPLPPNKEFSSTNYQEWRLKNPALYHIASGIGYTLATKNVVHQPAALHHLGPC